VTLSQCKAGDEGESALSAEFLFATELEAFWYCSWLEHLWRVADEGASVPWLLLRVRGHPIPSDAMSFFTW